MKKKLLQLLANSSLVRSFVAKPSPRWMVLVADLVLIAFSCTLTLAFGSHSLRGSGFIGTPAAKAIIEFAVYGLLAMLLGTSRYIIRLSVIEDTYRLVQL
ncbi:MAG: hypothetical protein K2F79_01460, partial [Muribaculaceae bacterium]|nr:hypothetical protein [Muribaculaceae bacterium]